MIVRVSPRLPSRPHTTARVGPRIRVTYPSHGSRIRVAYPSHGPHTRVTTSGIHARQRRRGRDALLCELGSRPFSANSDRGPSLRTAGGRGPQRGCLSASPPAAAAAARRSPRSRLGARSPTWCPALRLGAAPISVVTGRGAAGRPPCADSAGSRWRSSRSVRSGLGRARAQEDLKRREGC